MFPISLWLFCLALVLALVGGAGVTGLMVAMRLFGRDDLGVPRPSWRAEDSAPPPRRPAVPEDRLDDWPEEVEEQWPEELRDPPPPRDDWPEVAERAVGRVVGCGCHEAAARVGLHEAGARPPAPPAGNGSYQGTMGSLRQPPVPAGVWTP